MCPLFTCCFDAFIHAVKLKLFEATSSCEPQSSAFSKKEPLLLVSFLLCRHSVEGRGGEEGGDGGRDAGRGEVERERRRLAREEASLRMAVEQMTKDIAQLRENVTQLGTSTIIVIYTLKVALTVSLGLKFFFYRVCNCEFVWWLQIILLLTGN